ncbi:uncharacterized protein Z520_02095 [Fonsecaea multimorphosa CBS 102226]|uniref:Uncharacterized protein n=1 Tax=Fonsecaea multimorphosa CBS 102226 TaxID=1442371 RepID=A0A0D2IY57_9EURO|nr:uncharacterized protein Z520_02095 [Fonsecaea multimorphosa CBS 102226]KIY01957.1 hypothetical protein Z520_02095 [Fonsecaea multimorphosa CBS 102226]OAL29639.1 hypothetical protein AYO22_02053 [Fonsecaea multimorphosa]
MARSNVFAVIVILISVLELPFAVAQNSCGTDQNPYCAGDSTFEQLCCPYPDVCYWQNRNGDPGCCPAGQVCDGSSPYYTSTLQPTPTLQTTTIHPSTITVTPTPAPPPPTTVVTGGGVIIITASPNGGSTVTVTSVPNIGSTVTITTHPNSVSTITTIYSSPCGGGVCSTVTSGVVGVYSTVTSVIGGAFSTVTSGAASAFSTVSGVLVGSNDAARMSPTSMFLHFVATLFALVGNLLG